MSLILEFAGTSSTALAMADVLDSNEVEAREERNEDARAQGFTGAEVFVAYALVLGAIKTAQLVDDMIYRLRQRHRPFMVLDVTGDEPKLTIIEDAPGMDGELLVKSAEGDELRLDHGASDDEVSETIQRFMGITR